MENSSLISRFLSDVDSYFSALIYAFGGLVASGLFFFKKRRAQTENIRQLTKKTRLEAEILKDKLNSGDLKDISHFMMDVLHVNAKVQMRLIRHSEEIDIENDELRIKIQDLKRKIIKLNIKSS